MLVVDALKAESTQLPLGELGGTRHQSAARFVLDKHEAMVFVGSQDGRLTVFAWATASSEVAAIRRLEHFVWE